MESEPTKRKNFGLLIVIILIAGLWIWSNYRRINELESTVNYQEEMISEYQNSLSEANDNIDKVNSMIDDAKGYTWGTYEDMGNALDDIETVDTVSEP